MPFQNWTSTDWTITGLILDVLGAFILVKGLLFNPFRREEAGTYFGFNPFLMRGDLGRKLDTIIGFLLIIAGFALQAVGSLSNFFRGTADSTIFSSCFSLSVFVFFIFTTALAAVFVPSRIALCRYRKENAKTSLLRIQEKIAEVQSGYLRKDLREMPEDRRLKIPNLPAIIEAIKEQARETIDQTEKLFQIKRQGQNDLERLKNIEHHLSKWGAKI